MVATSFIQNLSLVVAQQIAKALTLGWGQPNIRGWSGNKLTPQPLILSATSGTARPNFWQGQAARTQLWPKMYLTGRNNAN